MRVSIRLDGGPGATPRGPGENDRTRREGSRGDPDREMEAWLEKLAEVERMRGGYQELAAKGLMTQEDLGTRLERLEKTRSAAERELEILRRKNAWSVWSRTRRLS